MTINQRRCSMSPISCAWICSHIQSADRYSRPLNYSADLSPWIRWTHTSDAHRMWLRRPCAAPLVCHVTRVIATHRAGPSDSSSAVDTVRPSRDVRIVDKFTRGLWSATNTQDASDSCGCRTRFEICRLLHKCYDNLYSCSLHKVRHRSLTNWTRQWRHCDPRLLIGSRIPLELFE